MSEDAGLLGDDELDAIDQPTNQDWARARTRVREEKRRADEAQAAAEQQKRENAFLKAGINPEDPRLRYFAAGYSGEITPEAIRETAIRDGFLSTEQQPDPQAQAQRQQAAGAQQAVTEAADGGLPPGTDAVASLDDAFRSGGDSAVEDALRQAGVPIRYSS